MKHLNLLSTISLGIIFLIACLFAYWIFLEPDVVDVKNVDSFAVDKQVYHPGDRVTYTFSYCKTRKTVAVVNRALLDTYRITYATVNSDLPVGCHTINKNDLVIPEFIVGDGHTYHIEGTAEYKLNPIRSQFVYFRTVDFKVVNK